MAKVEVKGKFITLTGYLMGLYEKARADVDKDIFKAYGKHWNELDPEGWYDCTYYNNLQLAYAKASLSKEKALITLGKQIYPTIKKTVGFPPNLKTPLDFIIFESDGYTQNHRGPGIKPRTFVKKVEGNIDIQFRMDEQQCKVLEGIYVGMLEMLGFFNGEVVQTKCIKHNDPYCEIIVKYPWPK